MQNNIILQTDSYKISHPNMYPPNTQYIYSYFQSRGPIDKPKWPETVFFGLQYPIKEYLMGKVVTKEKIDEAEEVLALHFNDKSIFNRAGWEYILDKYDGHLPVRIKAVPEGTVVPRLNVLMTIENTDPKCFWLTNYLETLLTSNCWYGTTVATQSREFKILILQYMKETGADESLIDFKLHDFGFRGVSSAETAGLGGCAHLVNFKGTDTLAGITFARKYYNCPMAGYSIPAAEHSTITSWGKEHEKDAYLNILKQYPKGLVAVVSDSYDIVNACRNIWGKDLKNEVIARQHPVIIRPDSGDPTASVLTTLDNLSRAFGTTNNAKGYKVLNNVRVIQGDGINYDTVQRIMVNMKSRKWSMDNVSFGSGGALLQKLNRDTLKFAFKCSSITIDGKEQDVFKSPSGDKNKSSKKGRLKLVIDDKTGQLTTVLANEPGEDLLQTVFENGKLLAETTLDKIRELAFVNNAN